MNQTPIVAIGASAGGLKEFERFFKSLPTRERVAYVIIQHLAPDYKSILADIVSRYTEMDVSQVVNHTRVEEGKVYIIPPNEILTIEDGSLVLTRMSAEEGRPLPIDIFFKSLADSLGEKAIALVLSGTGSDGARGIGEVHAAGGLTLVQEPSTAEYDGMPLSAIQTGKIDFVIPVEEMAQIILSYVNHDFTKQQIIHPNNKQVRKLIWEILDKIRKLTGHDFSKYKINTIHRRIERRLNITKSRELEAYVELLNNDPGEIRTLYNELLINVTSFFRDTETFRFVEQHVIPKVFSRVETGTVRIWIPACATGEEAFTWAILAKKFLESSKLNLNYQIFASDIDVKAIEKAREGFYPVDIEEDVPVPILDKYFIRERDGFRVKKSIREKVIFADQNLLQDPPYSKIDIVSCRNLLIYLDADLQQKAISIFHFALNTKGVLLLGNSESLGKLKQHYHTVNQKHKVFEKIESPDISRRVLRMPYERIQKDQPKKTIKETPIADLAKEFVLERHAPPGIVIDYDGEMIYAQGNTGKFIEISTGEVTTNIIKMAREGLKIPLTNAIRKAKASNQEVVHKGIRIKDGDSYQHTDLLVAPLKKNNKEMKLLMVLFQSASIPGQRKKIYGDEGLDLSIINQLEKELAEKEEYLQSTIEELETTNEELKASNEEAQSTNEELQSINEELETSKEELQSVNEELTTTNTELNIKVEELDNANSKLENLLKATSIATIFLDRDLRVSNFTPSASTIIELRATDIGRPITHFTNKLAYGRLVEDCKEVLQSLLTKEEEVHTPDDRFFWMRILPYRTISDTIDGVVITFTDITEKKKQEKELEKYREHLEVLVDEKSRELKESEKLLNETGRIANIGGWKFDAATEKIIWTREVYRIHEVPYSFDPNLKKALSFYDEETRRVIDEAFSKALNEGVPYELELKFVTANGKEKVVKAIGIPNTNGNKNVVSVHGTFQDITESKQMENDLRESEEMFRSIFNNTLLGAHLYELREEGLCLVGANPAADKILSQDNTALFGQPIEKVFPSLLDEEALSRFREIAKKGGTWRNDNLLHEGEDASRIFENFNFQIAPNKMVSMFNDITDRLESEKLKESNSTKDKFFNIISHDLRSPISSMVILIEMLMEQKDLSEEEEEELIKHIHGSAKKIQRLTHDLLNWSMTQSDKLKLVFQQLSVMKLVEDNISLVRNSAVKKEISLYSKIGEDLYVKGDKNTINTILRNLISNAIKFTSPGGTIEVKAALTEEGNYVRIDIEDNGVGMSAEQVENLFEDNRKSIRLGTQNEMGTGLGLSISKEFIEKNHGSISVESESGRGSTFSILLPSVNSPKTPEKKETGKKLLSILVVDDDKLNHFVIRGLLERKLRINCKLIDAYNGLEAVEIAKNKDQVDLIFMELDMPQMDGYQSCKEIKKILPDVPVIAQTGTYDSSIRKKAFDAGFEEVLVKPLHEHVIQNTIKKYLNS